MSAAFTFYRELLGDIKDRVRTAQHKAALSANAEMIALYWDIGSMIAARQKEEGWGAGVIPRLAVDLKNELPEQKGFSVRNIGYMIRFAREYDSSSILQRSVAKLEPQPVAPIGKLEIKASGVEWLGDVPVIISTNGASCDSPGQRPGNGPKHLSQP